MDIVLLRVDVKDEKLNALEQRVQALKNTTLNFTIDDAGLTNLITTINNAATSAETMGTKVDEARLKVENFNSGAGATAKTVQQFSNETETATKRTLSFGDSLTKRAVWQIASNMITQLAHALKEVVSTMKEVDTQLTNIQKVSQRSEEDLNRLGDAAYKVASQYGVAAEEYLSAVYTFEKAGLGDSAETLAEIAIKAQLVGDTTSAVAEKFLVAANAAWQLNGSADALNKILDEADYVNNNYATTLDKIAAGLPIVASTAANAGMSMEDTIAALGTITSVTQESGSKAATALRALILNIMGAAGEYEDGIEVTEESIKSLDTILRKYAGDAMAAADAAGEIINPMEAIAALAEANEKGYVNQKELFEVLSSLGGKLRTNQLTALVTNFGLLNQMMDGMATSAGTADAEVSTMLNSWESKVNILKNTWADFVQKTIDTEWIKGLIGAITDLLKFVGNLANAIGVLGGLFIAFKAENVISALEKLGDRFRRVGDNVKEVLTGIKSYITQSHLQRKAEKETALATELRARATELETLAEKANTTSSTENAIATELNAAASEADEAAKKQEAIAIKAVDKANQAASVSASAALGVIGLVIMAISALVMVVQNITAADEEAREQINETAKAYSDAQKSAEELRKEYAKEYDSYGNLSEKIEAFTEYKQKLAEAYDVEIDKINDLVAARNGELRAVERELALEKANETLNDVEDTAMRGVERIATIMSKPVIFDSIGVEETALAGFENITGQMIADLENLGITFNKTADGMAAFSASFDTTKYKNTEDALAGIENALTYIRENEDMWYEENVYILPLIESGLKDVKNQIVEVGNEYGDAMAARNTAESVIAAYDAIGNKVVASSDAFIKVYLSAARATQGMDWHAETLEYLVSLYPQLAAQANLYGSEEARLAVTEAERAKGQIDSAEAAEAVALAALNSVSSLSTQADIIDILVTAFPQYADAINDVADSIIDLDSAQENATKSAKELYDEIQAARDNVATLRDALQEQASTGVLSKSTIDSLIEAYPQLINSLELTENGYRLNEKALERLIEAEAADYKLKLNEAQSAASAAISALGSEAQALGVDTSNWVKNAAAVKAAMQARIAQLNALYSFGKAITTVDQYLATQTAEYSAAAGERARLSNAVNLIDNYLSELDAYNYVTGISGGGSGGSSSGGSSGGSSKSSSTSTTDEKLEKLKSVVSLRKSELDVLEAQGASEKSQIASIQHIQAALMQEIKYLESIGAEQEEINGLYAEYYDWNSKIEKLQKNIFSELEDAIDAQLDKEKDKLDAQLETINKQIDALKAKKENQKEQTELAEKELAVKKAQIALENAQKERTVRYYNAKTGKWEWGADANNVASAKEALQSAKDALADHKAESEYQAKLDALEAKKDALNVAYDATEASWQKIIDSLQEPTKSISQVLKEIGQSATPDLKSTITSLNTMLKKFGYSISTSGTTTTTYTVKSGDTLSSIASKYGTTAAKIASANNISAASSLKIGQKLKIYDSGGVLSGIGGIKATQDDEIVLPPDLVKFMLTPTADSVFRARMDELKYMYGASPQVPASLTSNVNRNSYDHSGAEYHLGNITLNEQQAKSTTVYQLAQLSRGLAIRKTGIN